MSASVSEGNGPDVPATDRSSGPPDTGHPEIDNALESLGGLVQLPLAEHHDQLARVHEVLHSALQAPADPAQPG